MSREVVGLPVLRREIRPRAQFCEACGASVADGDGRGRGRRGVAARRSQPDQHADGRNHERLAAPTVAAPWLRRVRLAGRRRRLLHGLRLQGRLGARPLRGAAGAVGGRGVRPRHQALTATRTRWRCTPSRPGRAAVLIVCDGVSNSDGLRRRLAGGREGGPRGAAAAVPQGHRRRRQRRCRGHPGSDDGGRRRQHRGHRPHRAVVADDPRRAPSSSASSTGRRSCAVIGDTRAYLLPDAGGGTQLLHRRLDGPGRSSPPGDPRWRPRPPRRRTRSPSGSARDSPDVVPRVGPSRSTEPGWLLVCSDGLWNYASEAGALRAQVDAARHDRAARPRLGPGGLGERAGRPGQHHRHAGPGRPCRPRRCERAHERRKAESMAEFTAEVYQNEFLPDGGTDVNAIVSVTCRVPALAGQGGSAAAGEIIIIDTSGSMGGSRWRPPSRRRRRRSTEIVDGTYFAVDRPATAPAFLVYPPCRAGRRWCRWTRELARPGLRGGGAAARRRRDRDQHLADLAGSSSPRCREVQQRHAILLTDGENNERAGRARSRPIDRRHRLLPVRLPRRRRRLEGGRDHARSPRPCSAPSTSSRRPASCGPSSRRSCARHVAWRRRRRAAGLGSAGLAGRLRQAGVPDRGGPHRAAASVVNDLTGGYPTGAWSDESRDYHVAIRLAAKAIGQEQLAARVQVVAGGEVEAQGLVKAKWSDDSALTTRIDQQVAHYTGQAELAQVIQEGLAAKAVGDEETATTKLGRAVQLAAETGNDEATAKLRKVVDIEDADDRHGPAQEGRREGRRDGPGHRVDEDHAGPQVMTCPNGHDVRGHRLLRHLRRDRWTPAPPCRAPCLPTVGAARCRRRRQRPAARAGRQPHRSRRRGRAPTAEHPTRRTPCSARSAATTTRPAPCRAAPQRRRPPLRPPAEADAGQHLQGPAHAVGGRALDRPRLVRRPGQLATRCRARARRRSSPLRNTSLLIGPRLDRAAASTPTSTAGSTTASAGGTPS